MVDKNARHDYNCRMEHLSRKPFFLTDEEILWVGNTLADKTDEERITHLQHAIGSPFDFTDHPELEACLVFPAYINEAIQSGTLPPDDVREVMIQILGTQAALGLHK